VYGPAKKREASLSPTDIATRVGTYKESIVRAIRSLKAGGVLRETETGVRFVKDYEAWTWNGEPRLTAREQAYCRTCIPSNASIKLGNESVPNPSTHDGNESVLASSKPGNESAPISTDIGNESVPRRERIGSPAGTKALPDGNESVPRAHYVDRAGLRIELRKGEEGREDPPCPPVVSKAGTPEADRVANLAAEIGGDIGWAMWACNRFKMGDEPKIVEAALDAAVDAKIIDTTYVAKIIKRLNREGLPKESPSRNGFKGRKESVYPTLPYAGPVVRDLGPKMDPVDIKAAIEAGKAKAAAKGRTA
jgi:hypothetical protein